MHERWDAQSGANGFSGFSGRALKLQLVHHRRNLGAKRYRADEKSFGPIVRLGIKLSPSYSL